METLKEKIERKIKVFDKFEFHEKEHYYTYGNKRISISTTKLIEQYTKPFDADVMAKMVANKRETTKEVILREWKQNNVQATRKGTEVHAYAQELWNNNKYMVDYSKFEKIVNKNIFKIAYDKSTKLADNFYQEYKEKYTVVKDELLIASEEFDIAGSIDNLFINNQTNGIILADYKTNKEIKYKGFRGAKMKVPFQNCQDCNYEHYCLQLNIYQYLFEKYTGLKIEEKIIVYFNENAEDYEIIPVKDLQKEVKEILEIRRKEKMKSIPVLILGTSGSGKTTSFRNLLANETAIINVTNKPMPFKNTNKLVIKSTADYETIKSAIESTKKRIIVIDDASYLMSFENFDKANEKGYDKFTKMALNFYNLIKLVLSLDGEKIVYIVMHEELEDVTNIIKPKTIGKMLNQQLVIEGLFSIVLRAVRNDKGYMFQTHNDRASVCKTPIEMFEDDFTPNDLAEVDKVIRAYYDFTPIDKELKNKKEEK